MVSAGIGNTIVNSIRSDTRASRGEKSSVSETDFTKVLAQQSDGNYSAKYDKKNENLAKSDTVKEIIQKTYVNKEKNPVTVNKQKKDIGEAMSDVYSNIVNVIAEQLGIEPEKVVDTINELQLNIGDLLDTKNTNQIVAELTGMESVMSILTDTDLSEKIKNIYSEISMLAEEFQKNFGITQEELGSMLDDVAMIVGETGENKDAIMSVLKEMDKSFSGELNHEIESDGDEVVQSSVISGETKVNVNKADNHQESSQGKQLTGNSDTTAETIHDNKHGIAGNQVVNVFEEIRETVAERIIGEDNGLADRIVKQITDDIKLYARQDTTALEIQLEPESLGKVSLTVASKAGSVTAHLVVQNEVAREAIESQVSTLKESMNQQGIKIEAIEVTVASKEFEENLDRQKDTSEQQGQRRKKHLSGEELSEINGTNVNNNDDTVKEEIMKEMGNTVSYIA